VVVTRSGKEVGLNAKGSDKTKVRPNDRGEDKDEEEIYEEIVLEEEMAINEKNHHQRIKVKIKKMRKRRKWQLNHHQRKLSHILSSLQTKTKKGNLQGF